MVLSAQLQQPSLARPCVIAVHSSKPAPAGRGSSLPHAAPSTPSSRPRASRVQRHVIKAVAAEPPVLDQPAVCPRGAHWQIHKFGGTCVAAAERITAAAQYIVDDAATANKVVVVSAMGSHPSSPVKVTDLLLDMVSKASRQDEGFLLDLTALQQKHVETANALLGPGKELNDFVARLLDDIANLKAMLHAISIAGMSTDAFEEFVVGHGELWCAQLMASKCRQLGGDAAFMDTREVLVVTPTSDGGSVDVQYEASNGKLDAWVGRHGVPAIIIATGFIAKNPQGQATTLKRNGSDYSATILGALFEAGHITIWTDVDGIYSADPRKVPESVCLRHLSYHEAWELSYFGANVLHPRTTLPAMRYNIPISIRNFFNLPVPGTVISDGAALPAGIEAGVKGFATIDDVSLINVEGTGMVGVPGVASAIFTVMRDIGVNVIMISQASSEHSVCFAVKAADTEKTLAALRKRFSESIAAGRISQVEAIQDCCVLAAVGQQMASRRGVAATMFDALAKTNINVRAIAQGCSEYNITALIDGRDAVRALRAVHGRFYLDALPIGIGLVGPGLIGGTLLDQIAEQAEVLRQDHGIDLRVLGIASAKGMLLKDSGVDLSRWREELAPERLQPTDLTFFADHLVRHYVPNTVIIDCTASEEVSTHYLDWMQEGIHLITPNKKMNSGPLERYTALKTHQRSSYIHYFYECTVGAGLPVMSTLQHLITSGDRVERIEGIFSGTLSYIFNTFGTDGRPFSEVVAGAKAAGFTEPDPRDDLAGMDVARKVTILARECGIPAELEKVPVDSLVPEPLRACASAAEYMARLPEFDGEMDALLREADAAGECLRYVGVVDCKTGACSVELRRYPKDHPFAQLSGSDNIISFQTRRYNKQPLIVRGPGAGAEVTAGGVFSDLLSLACYLGAAS